jgi:hypothetical protein
LSLLAAACASTKPATPIIATTTAASPAPVPSICIAWKPISYSASGDTTQTVQGVIEANALMAGFCNPQPVAVAK